MNGNKPCGAEVVKILYYTIVLESGVYCVHTHTVAKMFFPLKLYKLGSQVTFLWQALCNVLPNHFQAWSPGFLINIMRSI